MGEVRQVVSPTLPFHLSLPSPFPFPLSFQANQWEGMSDPVRGKFPGSPPTNITLLAAIVTCAVWRVGDSGRQHSTVCASQRQRHAPLHRQERAQDDRRRRNTVGLLRVRLDTVRRVRVLHDPLRGDARAVGGVRKQLLHQVHHNAFRHTLLPPDKPLSNVYQRPEVMILSFPGVELIFDLSSLTVCLNLSVCDFAFTYVSYCQL